MATLSDEIGNEVSTNLKFCNKQSNEGEGEGIAIQFSPFANLYSFFSARIIRIRGKISKFPMGIDERDRTIENSRKRKGKRETGRRGGASRPSTRGGAAMHSKYRVTGSSVAASTS